VTFVTLAERAAVSQSVDEAGRRIPSGAQTPCALHPFPNPTLRGFAAGETRAGQRANLDALIGAWADTSAMRGSREAASDLAPAVVVQWQFAGVATYSVLDVLRLFGEGQAAAGSFQMAPSLYDQSQSAEYGAWVRKLELLEKFNGQTFVNPIVFQTPAAIQVAQWEKLIEQSGGGGGTEAALSSVACINVAVSLREEARI